MAVSHSSADHVSPCKDVFQKLNFKIDGMKKVVAGIKKLSL
jgi:hypothetical protein